MKRLLAVGAAAVALFTLAGLGTPATAGPDARITARLSIDRNCLATVHVAWSGLDPDWLPMTSTTLINIVGDTDGTSYQQSGAIPVTTAKGTGTWTRQGAPRAAGKQINTATFSLTAWSDSSVKVAACSW